MWPGCGGLFSAGRRAERGAVMVHRGIASLAVALALCFLLLGHFDPQFFLIHFYESLIYLTIVLMLFYLEDRWAYMMGIVAPATWLLLTGLWGGIRGLPLRLSPAFHPGSSFFPAGLLTIFAIVLSIALIVGCAYRWRREFTGLGKGRSTLLVSLGVVAVYYALLVLWILRWPPSVA
jgi:hypothetical protein